VLDVAAGRGRNARWLAQQGFQVVAVDRDAKALSVMRGIDGITLQVKDLEGDNWPYEDEQFDAIVVFRYLYRPLFPKFVSSLAPEGILVYETFMQGQEAYGKPGNPNFLLVTNELQDTFQEHLDILAFEQGLVTSQRPCMMQRIVGKKRIK
jgi:SAM-dependent methyltransferase